MTILRLDKPFKVKLFFQCGTKKKKKRKSGMLLPLPSCKCPLSRENAVAEVSPFFVHNCICHRINAVHNSEHFTLVKMYMQIICVKVMILIINFVKKKKNRNFMGKS